MSMATDTDDIDKLFEETESIDNIITKVSTTTTTEQQVTIEASENAGDSKSDMILPIIHRRY
jgi:hypothetical protein